MTTTMVMLTKVDGFKKMSDGIHHPSTKKRSLAATSSVVLLLLVLTLTPTYCDAFQTPIARSFLSRQTSASSVSTPTTTLTSSSDGDNHQEVVNTDAKKDNVVNSRRGFLTSTTAAVVLAATTAALPPFAIQPANAGGGLVQFPCERPLKNRYHFMRAGQSELEQQGIYSTNPLFLTNRENAMDSRAQQMVLDVCDKLQKSGNYPTVAYHSLAANTMDTADLLATTMKMGRDRLLPEFTYLDQRGVGLWDSGASATVQPAIWAMDYAEAGTMGTGGRPPANEDGTPNETLADQFVRLRQFLSLQEARTSGENILIIFPDGTGPALLSVMIAGIPYRHVHALNMEPGELRLDITKESILDLYKTRKDEPAYLAMLEDGKEQLVALREQTEAGGMEINLKTQREDIEREAIDRAFEEGKLQRREAEAAKVQAKQAQLQLELEQKQARIDALKQDQIARKQAKEQARFAASGSSGSALVAPSDDDSADSSINMAAIGAGVVGMGVFAAVGLGGGGSDTFATEPIVAPKKDDEDGMTTTPTSSLDAQLAAAGVVTTTSTVAAVSANGTVAVTLPSKAATLSSPTPSVDDGNNKEMVKSALEAEIVANSPVAAAGALNNDDIVTEGEMDSETIISEELIKLEAAQDAMDQALMEDPTAIAARKNPVELEMDLLEQQQKAMDSYLDLDDGGSDWLQVLAEIRDAPEDEENNAVVTTSSTDGDAAGDITKSADL